MAGADKKEAFVTSRAMPDDDLAVPEARTAKMAGFSVFPARSA